MPPLQDDQALLVPPPTPSNETRINVPPQASRLEGSGSGNVKRGGGLCGAFLIVILIIKVFIISVRMTTPAPKELPIVPIHYDYEIPKIPEIPIATIPDNFLENDKNLCTSLECMEASQQLKSSMDESFVACEDFYQYACQGWIREYSSKMEKEENSTQALTELDKRNFLLVNKLLMNNFTSSSSVAETKARSFYNSCFANKRHNIADYMEELGVDLKNNKTSSSPPADDYMYLVEDNGWGWSHWEKYFPKIKQKIRPFLEDKTGTEFKESLCTALTWKLFPEVVARLFVSNNFTSYEDQVARMIDQTTSTYETMIATIPWMDWTTISYLQDAFNLMYKVVGYPQIIMDISYVDSLYENVTVSDTSYFKNLFVLAPLRHKTPAGSEVENTMRANAYYMPLKDSLIIPAGIIQFPFFHKTFPDVLNFAKFTTTVGHELTHALQTYINGIDLLGGLLQIPPSALVSNTTRDKFEELSQCVIDQYNNMEVPLQESKLMMNGKATVNENLADIIGMQVAFKTFLDNPSSPFSPLPSLEKFSKEQLFFIAAAQNQCETFSNQKTEAGLLKDEVKVSVHSPNSIRVLGQMRNFDEFSKAFNCPRGSRYNPVEKCRFFGKTIIERMLA